LNIEVKYAIPRLGGFGKSFTRLVNQASAVKQAGQRLVVWSIRRPNAKQIRDVVEAVRQQLIARGVAPNVATKQAARIRFANGIDELYSIVQQFVRGIF